MKDWIDFGIVLPAGATSGEVQMPCPTCSPKRKKKNSTCLSVNVDKGVWNCHHCFWTGSLNAGAQSRSNPNVWKDDVYEAPKLAPLPISDKARAWFEKRKILDTVLRRNQICMDTQYFPQTEDWMSCIAFPFFKNGQVVNYKYRAPDNKDGSKNLRMAKNAELVFYGLDDIWKRESDGTTTVEEKVFIVEGELDKLAMECAGYENVLSVPNGAPPVESKKYAEKFDFIARSNIKLDEDDEEGLLDRVQMFYIAVDNDGPGRKLKEELIRRLGQERCVVVEWPEGCKDANDVILNYSYPEIQTCVERAQKVRISGVFRLSDFEKSLDDHFQYGLKPGLTTGWTAFHTEDGHEIYTIEKGRLTLITGSPGHGKTTFGEALCVNLAQLHGWKFGWFSPETQPLSLQASLLIEKWARLPFTDGIRAKMPPDVFEESKRFVNDHWLFLLPEEESFDIEALLERAALLVRHYGIDGLYIDPWNSLAHSHSDDMREDQYIKQSLRKIRMFARKYDVHVWIVVHPGKVGKVKGKDGVVTPYDIKGGSEWFDMADFILSCWRDKSQENGNKVIVQKAKFRHLGTIGQATLGFDMATGNYYDTGKFAELATGKPAEHKVNRQAPRASNPYADEPPPWLDVD